jgi:hypothetical protein
MSASLIAFVALVATLTLVSIREHARHTILASSKRRR